MGSILVTGATGQIGNALQASLANRDAVFLSREELDLSQAHQVRETLNMFPTPAAIINAAAYTAVDKAEEEEALATTINATSVGVMAEYCAKHTIPLLHYSTDYVYAGDEHEPRTESAPVNPQNAYGRSKLAGEEAVRASGCAHLIFRTCWVYDATGTNFLNTMLRLGAERELLRVVADQIGAPSYAQHLADASVAALDAAMAMESFPAGVYHMCNGGETSWHGFALAIFEQAQQRGQPIKVQQVEPIATIEYPTPASRPLNSRLSCDKLKQTFGIALPDWREGLSACMEAKEQNGWN